MTGIPAELSTAITKALERDPAVRYQRMDDLVVDLRRTLRHSGAAAIARAKTRSRPVRAIAAAVLIVIAIAATLAFRWFREPRATSAAPLAMRQLTSFTDSATQPAVSPDGRMIAFVRGPTSFVDEGQIYVKMLPDGELVALTKDSMRKVSPLRGSSQGSRHRRLHSQTCRSNVISTN